MKDEVKEHLVTGLAQYLNGKAAGSSRFVITDSYQGIDNAISAFLLEIDEKPSRNHKRKLDMFLEKCSSALAEKEIDVSKIEEFYESWLDTRYTKSVPTPNEAYKYRILSLRIFEVIIKEIADRNGMSYEQLEEELYNDVLGNRWLKFEEEVGYIHERWQQHEEELAMRGLGTKLGNKMLNPSNFSDINAFTDDDKTKRLLVEDEELSGMIADFYKYFLDVVEYIREKRIENGTESNEFPNFVLSIILRYQGQTLEEITKEWMSLLGKAFVINEPNDFN